MIWEFSMSAIFYKLSLFLIALAIPPFLVLGSVQIAMTEAFLRFEYNRADFPPDYYGLSTQQRLDYAPYVLQYVLSDANVSPLAALRSPDGSALFTPRELQHMIDVKVISQRAKNVFRGVVAILILLSVLLLRTSEGRIILRRSLSNGAVLLLTSLILLVVGMLINWQAFFSGFHSLFFASGTWVFEYSDSLIRLFPVHFWQDAAVTISVISSISAVLILIVCWLWDRRILRQSLRGPTI